MTQPEAAVGSEPIAPEPTLDERLDAQLGTIEDKQDELPEDAPEGDEPTEELTETDLEEEADDLPPIDAPVSWDGDAKEKFAQLPRDVQEYVQKREAERERFVQTKSQEATRARTEVEQEALRQLSAYEQQVSQHLQQYAQQFDVPEPDMSLLATDPHTYALQAKRYQDASAQRSQAQQAAEYYAQQAQEREQAAEQAHMAQQRQIIVDNFPEYADPTTGPKIQQELSAVAREMGYPPELIQQARATDIIAMRTAAEWKAKAARYDALNAKKMEKVRAAKVLPRVATPGSSQAPGAARQNQYASDREALRQGDSAATQRVLDSYFAKPK